MDKKTIYFRADDQMLVKTSGDDLFAANIVSYIDAVFDLGDNWSGFDAVRAVWSTYNKTISKVLDSDGKCEVPAEVLARPGRVVVNLVGSTSVDGVLQDRLTTYGVLAGTVDKDTKLVGYETPELTPSQFEQYVGYVREYWESIHDFRKDAEAWAVGQRDGADVSEDDEVYHNNSKYYAAQAKASADSAREDLEQLEAEIDESVDEYLTAHPEKTTTVQDGSLTEPKFSDALKLKTINNYVTPQMFGANGDGIVDDTVALSEAIAYCNENTMPLFIPAGTYLVNNALPTLASGFVLFGDSSIGNKTIIKSSYAGYFLTCNANVTIKGIAFVGNQEDTFGLDITGGWTSLFENLSFSGFIVAMNLKADDAWISHCRFVFCGGYYNNAARYAVELPDGSNHKRFDNCHFEHCRYFVKSGSSNVYENWFVNCKFEQSTFGLNADLTPPINCLPTYNLTSAGVVFSGCSFACLNTDIYTTLATIASYANAPYFMYAGTCIVDNCVFYGNSGSGDYLDTNNELHKGFLAVDANGFSKISNCIFQDLLRTNDVIKLRNQSYLDSCRLWAKSDDPYLTTTFNCFINSRNVFNSMFNAMTVARIIPHYKRSNKIFTSAGNIVDVSDGFNCASGAVSTYNTIKIKSFTNQFRVTFSIKCRMYGVKFIDGVFNADIMRNNNTVTLMSASSFEGGRSENAGNDFIMDVYWDESEMSLILQLKKHPTYNYVLSVDGFDGMPFHAWVDTDITAQSAANKLGTI